MRQFYCMALLLRRLPTSPDVNEWAKTALFRREKAPFIEPQSPMRCSFNRLKFKLKRFCRILPRSRILWDFSYVHETNLPSTTHVWIGHSVVLWKRSWGRPMFHKKQERMCLQLRCNSWRNVVCLCKASSVAQETNTIC